MPHRSLVRTQVRENITDLVRQLSAHYWPATVVRGSPQALINLCEQAHRLLADHEDWETPARAAGWLPEPGDTLGRVYLDATHRDGEDESYYHAADWQEACNRMGLDPVWRPVTELWSVSEWMGERLEERGELVREFASLCVWSRTATTPVEDDETVKAIWRSVTDLPFMIEDGGETEQVA